MKLFQLAGCLLGVSDSNPSVKNPVVPPAPPSDPDDVPPVPPSLPDDELEVEEPVVVIPPVVEEAPPVVALDMPVVLAPVPDPVVPDAPVAPEPPTVPVLELELVVPVPVELDSVPPLLPLGRLGGELSVLLHPDAAAPSIAQGIVRISGKSLRIMRRLLVNG